MDVTMHDLFPKLYPDKSKSKRKPRKSTSPRQLAVCHRNFRRGRIEAIISHYNGLILELQRDGATIKFKALDTDKFRALMNLAVESAYAAQCNLHPRKQDCPALLDKGPTT